MVSGSGMPRWRFEFSAQFREAVAHAIAERLAVNGLAFQGRLGSLHDLAHVLDGIRAGFGDRFGNRRVHFGLAGAGREIRFNDGELFGFFFGEFGAVALGKLLDRFLALFYEHLQDLNGLRLVEYANLFDFLVLDGRLDTPQHAEAQFVFGAHGVDQVLLNFLGKTHLRFLASLNIADREISREEMVRGNLARYQPYLFDSARRARYFGIPIPCGENAQETTGLMKVIVADKISERGL